MQCSEEIAIFGYMGADVKTPSADKPNFITFSVGVQRKGKDGSKDIYWYKCLTSNEYYAEYVKKYLIRKSKVWIRGIPKLNIYEDRNNKTHAEISITLTAKPNILRYGSGNGDGDDSGSSVTPMGNNTNAVLDDEIPF